MQVTEVKTDKSRSEEQQKRLDSYRLAIEKLNQKDDSK